jgi:hypothetical protein
VFDIHPQAAEHDRNKPFKKVSAVIVRWYGWVIGLTLLYSFLQYSQNSGMEVVANSSEDLLHGRMK